MSSELAAIDHWLSSTLTRWADELPARWKRWLAMYYPDARIRKLFWQKTGVEVGEDSFMNLGVVVVDDYQSGDCLLSIGARVSISPGVVFAADSSPNNSLAMQQHPFLQQHLIKRQRIIVEDDAWIGANVTVLPGVSVGRGAVIGAGAVVTDNVPPFTIAAGVPARVIRTLEPF